MAVRKIEYTVTAAGINPTTVKPGGVQGEHRATEIIFNLADELFLELKTMTEEGKRLVYRIDGYNGEGGVHRSDIADLTEASISYLLEEWLTRCGGIVKVVLVLSLIENDTTEMELYSFPANLQLKNLPDGAVVDGENYESMSTLAQVAKISAEVAVEAQGKTELAKVALEGDSEWVFDGGDADPDNEVDIEFVVDAEMSDASDNTVANKTIKKYVDESLKKVLLDAHPIGSLYFSNVSVDPAHLFGGTWERVKDKFILAAGDDYSAGDVGGNKEHSHTIDPDKAFAKFYYNGTLHTGWRRIANVTKAWESTEWLQITGALDANNKPEETTVDGGVGVYGDTDYESNMPPYEVYYCWKRTA